MNVVNRQKLCESIQGLLKVEIEIEIKFRVDFDLKLFVLPIEPEMTSPSSALITTELTACSCPVNVALGVGISPEMLKTKLFYP